MSLEYNNSVKHFLPPVNENGLRLGIYSQTHDVLVIVIYVLMGLLGVVFNLTAIIVMASSRRNNSIKLQLINLAIADLLTALFMPGYLIHHILILPFPENEHLSKFLCFVGLGVFYTGPMCNVAISIERFVAVYFPFRILRYRSRGKVAVICVVWMFGFTSALEGLIYGGISYYKQEMYGYQVPMSRCYRPLKHETLHIIIMMVKYLMPLVLITLMYLLISVKMCRQPNIQQTVSKKNSIMSVGRKLSSLPKARQPKQRVVKMLAVNTIVTILAWLPFEVLCGTSADHKREYIVVTAAFAGLQLSNCFTSPVIYFIFNKTFKEKLHNNSKKLGSWVSRKSSGPATLNTVLSVAPDAKRTSVHTNERF